MIICDSLNENAQPRAKVLISVEAKMSSKVGRGNSGHSSGLANLFLLCSGKKDLQQKLTLLTSTLVYVVPNTKLYACVVFSKVTETRYPL